MTYSMKRNAAASSLYLICDLEPHTGKLAQHVRFTKAASGQEKDDRWLLQVINWTQAAVGMDHTEVLADEPMITTTKDHFVLVHESSKTIDRANALMCRLRFSQQAPLNGYMVDHTGQVIKVKELHPKRKP